MRGKARTIEERIEDAYRCLREAQSIHVPPRGRERVGPLLRKRHWLERAMACVAAIAAQRTAWSRKATPEQIGTACRILDIVEAEWPLPQDQMREV